jgi:hypothetical protein
MISELIDFISNFCLFFFLFLKYGHRTSGRRRRDAWLEFKMSLNPGILKEEHRMLHNIFHFLIINKYKFPNFIITVTCTR